MHKKLIGYIFAICFVTISLKADHLPYLEMKDYELKELIDKQDKYIKKVKRNTDPLMAKLGMIHAYLREHEKLEIGLTKKEMQFVMKELEDCIDYSVIIKYNKGEEDFYFIKQDE